MSALSSACCGLGSGLASWASLHSGSSPALEESRAMGGSEFTVRRASDISTAYPRARHPATEQMATQSPAKITYASKLALIQWLPCCLAHFSSTQPSPIHGQLGISSLCEPENCTHRDSSHICMGTTASLQIRSAAGLTLTRSQCCSAGLANPRSKLLRCAPTSLYHLL